MGYTTQQVPARLQVLFKDSGLDKNLLQSCVTQYERWQAEAQAQVQQLSQANDSLLLDLQTQISEQIAQRSQIQTIETQMESGAISLSGGSSLLQSIER